MVDMGSREKNFRQIIARSSESNRFVLLSYTLILAVFIILLSKVPLIQIFNVTPHPSLISIAIFYWSLSDPERLSIYSLFFIGLFVDLLLISPIGIGFIIFLGLQYFVITQRATLLNHGLTVKLAFFSLIMFFFYFIIYFLVWRTHGHFPAVKAIIVPCLTTILCFIPFYRLFEMMDNLVFPSDLRG
jgi:rod shape-determining protein MreD